MPISKAQQKAVTRYVKNKYDRFGLTMPKGHLDEIKAHAAAQGESVNSFINRAIDQTMSQEAVGSPTRAVDAWVASISLPLPSDTFKAAQGAAEAAGEAMPQFVARAVETQAQRDVMSRRMKGGEEHGD